MVGDESQDLTGDDLAGPQEAAGEPQRAELNGEAQAIVRPTPPRNHGEIGRGERVMPDQVGLRRGQCEQPLELGVGEGATTWHGDFVPIGVMSVQPSRDPSRNAGFRVITP